MQLIKTNDGLMGWAISGKVIWCDNIKQLCSAGWGHVGRMKTEDERQDFEHEVQFAIDTMVSLHHSKGHFGVFGNFMFSEQEF